MEVYDFTLVMKALSDANRVRALLALEGRELCVCQLIEMLQLAPSTVSKHMSILRQARLVDSRKDGRWIHYSLNADAGETIDALLQLVIGAVGDSKAVESDRKNLKKITTCNLETLCKRIMT